MERLPLRIVADGDAGLAGHIHYDPYFPRLLSHVKRLLAQDVPILVRLHPGMAYPMDEDTLHYRVDREGHVVALIGYDDDKQEFMIADPWNRKRWQGDRGGITGLPYEHLKIVLVDASLGYVVCVIPWEIEARLPDQLVPNRPITLEAKIKYPCPEPFSNADNHVSDCRTRLELPAGLSCADGTATEQLVGDGFLRPGEMKTVKWTLVRTGPVDGTLQIRVRGIVSNNDPYLYSDVIGVAGLVAIRTEGPAGRYSVGAPDVGTVSTK